jgi:hypothetical protein
MQNGPLIRQNEEEALGRYGRVEDPNTGSEEEEEEDKLEEVEDNLVEEEKQVVEINVQQAHEQQ